MGRINPTSKYRKDPAIGGVFLFSTITDWYGFLYFINDLLFNNY
jgi:hypothetical protein